MRKIILNLAISLDGFIEGPKGEFEWCLTDQDYGMTDFLKRTDAIFIGRKSYEVLNKTSNNPFTGKIFYLFSNTLALSNSDIIVIHDVDKEVKAIKNKKGKDIWLFGGAKLTASLLKAKLIDEIQLSVHPIILGNGKLLFNDIQKRVQLKLINSISYSSGLTQLHYQVLY
jgi:dihydrofolate reductase